MNIPTLDFRDTQIIRISDVLVEAYILRGFPDFQNNKRQTAPTAGFVG
jgi:ribosomal protein S17E